MPERKLLQDGGKHTFYCDGTVHISETCWELGHRSFHTYPCNCNVIKKIMRKIRGVLCQ